MRAGTPSYIRPLYARRIKPCHTHVFGGWYIDVRSRAGTARARTPLYAWTLAYLRYVRLRFRVRSETFAYLRQRTRIRPQMCVYVRRNRTARLCTHGALRACALGSWARPRTYGYIRPRAGVRPHTLPQARVRTPPHARTHDCVRRHVTCAQTWHTILQVRLTCQTHVGVCTQPYLS